MMINRGRHVIARAMLIICRCSLDKLDTRSRSESKCTSNCVRMRVASLSIRRRLGTVSHLPNTGQPISRPRKMLLLTSSRSARSGSWRMTSMPIALAWEGLLSLRPAK